MSGHTYPCVCGPEHGDSYLNLVHYQGERYNPVLARYLKKCLCQNDEPTFAETQAFLQVERHCKLESLTFLSHYTFMQSKDMTVYFTDCTRYEWDLKHYQEIFNDKCEVFLYRQYEHKRLADRPHTERSIVISEWPQFKQSNYPCLKA